MVGCSTCNVVHMLQFCRFFYCLEWSDTLTSIVCRVQTIRCTMMKFSWWSFRWSIPIAIDYHWSAYIDKVMATLFCSYCIWNRYCQNNRGILSNFPLFSMIWYGWIQSPAAVPKRQDVGWWCFRWSIPLSIDYVWNSCIAGVISTPSWPYCIWNSYIQIITVNLHDVGMISHAGL